LGAGFGRCGDGIGAAAGLGALFCDGGLDITGSGVTGSAGFAGFAGRRCDVAPGVEMIVVCRTGLGGSARSRHPVIASRPARPTIVMSVAFGIGPSSLNQLSYTPIHQNMASPGVATPGAQAVLDCRAMTPLDEAIRRFDAANAEDPNAELVRGAPVAKELVYGQRMSSRLASFAPDAPETVKLAARAQHIRRWEVPRDSYPAGRAGYLKWRSDLYKRHGDTAAAIMGEVGYDDETIDRVRTLLRKRGLKTDPEVQLLEDVVCLVFLEHYFHDFAKKHEEDKLISIVQKTWSKMTSPAHDAALRLDYAPEDLELIRKALADA